VKYGATTKGMTKNFFHPSLLLRILDLGSEIRDPGWVKNQDPGSGIKIPDPQHWPANILVFRDIEFKTPLNIQEKISKI
jgi:hypothetical protein